MGQSSDTARLLNQLSRHQVQQILENHGYGVFDKEPLEDLLEAVRQDLDSGEIDIAEIDMALDAGPAAPGR